ncbi:MAG: glutamine--tRNA ligase, partial [Paludibacteraceae bacterium]|nr:glutamine--tRNA ligase [Paludibacteraceae bacterium]
IKNFISRIGYTKYEATIDVSMLEASVREDLKARANRVCAIFDPVKLIIDNYPEGGSEVLTTENNPDNENAGTREITFSKELYIERGDFMENAPKDFYRLTPGGREVRLKSAYIIQCTGFDNDADGNITAVHCTYDPDTKSGTEGGNRKVKSTINWVDTKNAAKAEVRLYDRLFSIENPSASEKDFRELLNPDSLKVVEGCIVERSLASAKPLEHFQFLKQGYFTVDKDSTPEKPIFNRTVSLKDNWAKKS